MLYVVVLKVNCFSCDWTIFLIKFSLTYTHFSFRPCWCICKHDEEKDVPQVSNSETCFSIAGCGLWLRGVWGQSCEALSPEVRSLLGPQQPSHNLTAQWITEWVISLTAPLAWLSVPRSVLPTCKSLWALLSPPAWWELDWWARHHSWQMAVNLSHSLFRRLHFGLGLGSAGQKR